MKIAIVGGGAVGLSSALWLASYGHAVSVYEQGALGGGAMAAAAGILGAQSESDAPHAAFEGYMRARALWGAMAGRVSGGAPALGYRTVGLLKLGRAEHGARLADTARWQCERGAHAELLAPHALRERFPHVGKGREPGLWLPDEAQVEPALAALTLVNLLVGMGGALHAFCAAPALPELLASHDRVLVAAGVASAHLLPELAVLPVRGQLLEKRMKHAAGLPILMQGHMYAVPRGDGRVVIGATVEHGRDDMQVDVTCTKSLESAITELWPALSQEPVVRQWAGVRPYVAGGPTMREVRPRLWVSVGHHRNGILLALDAGEQAANHLLSRAHENLDAQHAMDALYTRIHAISRG